MKVVDLEWGTLSQMAAQPVEKTSFRPRCSAGARST